MIGMIGSVYSIAQIVGGLILGILSDRLEDRRTVLLMSFAGAAVAYAMVGVASQVWVLVCSRVIVGLFKQTMTASKAMAAAWSDDASRAEYMGLISSMAMAAWVTGSAATGFIRQLHPAAPSVVAVSLYAVDTVLVLACLPPVVQSAHSASKSGTTTKKDVNASSANGKAPSEKDDKKAGFFASFRRAFGNGAVGRFLAIRVLYGLVSRASMTQQDSWEMTRFGLKTGQLGSLRTVKSVVAVVFQGAVAGRAVRSFGERNTFLASLSLAAFTAFVEFTVTDVMLYTALAVPASLASSLLAGVSLESLMTHLVPSSELGASLAVLDVLSSAVGVIAPLIGGAVIQYLGLLARPLVSGASFLALFALALLFLPAAPRSPQKRDTEEKAETAALPTEAETKKQKKTQ